MNCFIYPVTLFSPNIYFHFLKGKLEQKKTTFYYFYYIEDPIYFTKYKFHKKKLLLHRASMKQHEEDMKKYFQKYKNKFIYIDFYKVPSFYKEISQKKNTIKEIYLFDPNDEELFNKINNLPLILFSSPGFLLTKQEALEYGKGKKKFFNKPFYIFMRKKTGYLMKDKTNPIGNKWSFDKNNRKKIPQDKKIPLLPTKKINIFEKEAETYVRKHFFDNYGEIKYFIYPVSRKEALNWLNNFIKKRANDFGPYQDYIMKNNKYLFHSVLSSSLNIGLLTPDEICSAMIQSYKKGNTSLDSCEGMIRQIISWREYCRMIYLSHGESNPNFFEEKRKLNKKFYEGTTGIEIIDQEIKKVLDSAYSHHIIRLMVFGNVFTLLGISPKEMYKWFMELFIDSYQWVMWANVYGMGSYADGGLTMGRPYISSSNYLKNMSNYPKGEWEDEIKSLYYMFLDKHKEKLKKIYATSSQVKYLMRMKNKKEFSNIKELQKKVLHRIF
jgi:deoxyribodipyrimidine photolyase-related protein